MWCLRPTEHVLDGWSADKAAGVSSEGSLITIPFSKHFIPHITILSEVVNQYSFWSSNIMRTLLIPYYHVQRSFAPQDLRSNHRFVEDFPPCPLAYGRWNSYKWRTLAYEITQAKYKKRQDIREVTGTANEKSLSLHCWVWAYTHNEMCIWTTIQRICITRLLMPNYTHESIQKK